MIYDILDDILLCIFSFEFHKELMKEDSFGNGKVKLVNMLFGEIEPK
jgi:hypothetical protein